MATARALTAVAIAAIIFAIGFGRCVEAPQRAVWVSDGGSVKQ